ncbi:MAG: hypothetical protein V9E83_05500 [Baekduia sp.]
MVARKQINTNVESVSCDVCGRSLLRGEHAEVFIAGGVRRSVCELCTVRAAHDGWIREGVDDPRILGEEQRRRSPLRGLIRARRPETQLEPGGAEALFSPSAEQPAVAGPAPARSGPAPLSADLRQEHQRARAVMAEQASAGEPALYEDRSVRGIPSNSELKVARAIELFNASPHVRTVAGVSRSLGVPMVCARPSLTEGSVVTIVVAWELSWYRFEVDLGDEGAGVRVVGQGTELEELDEADREANGTAGADGIIRYEAPMASADH